MMDLLTGYVDEPDELESSDEGEFDELAFYELTAEPLDWSELREPFEYGVPPLLIEALRAALRVLEGGR